jgi:hypothetical protein
MGSNAAAAPAKRIPRIKLRLELTGRGIPVAPPAPVEVSSQYADDGGLLELVPQGILFTRHIGDNGDIERLPDTWQTRYCFRVRIDGHVVLLDQVTDKYGHRLPFGMFDAPDGPHSNTPGTLRLAAGKPVTIYLNVPGGGPQWTLTLVGIE